MRVVIAGSRDMSDSQFPIMLESMHYVIAELGWSVTEVIWGGASGADTLGKIWASIHGVPDHLIEADWEYHRSVGNVRAAGPVRNMAMAVYASEGDGGGALVAFPRSGSSRGTMNMISCAKKVGLQVHIVELEF